MNDKPWYCYLLFLKRKTGRILTYVGATTDPFRRLRQHNGEITGGAKATTSKITNGDKWNLFCYVSGFPDQTAALQFEWKWKNLTRTCKNRNPIEKRLNALKKLVESGKSTVNSLPFSDYQNILELTYIQD